jgi:hypothetical protein
MTQATVCVRQNWFDLRQDWMIDNLNGHSGPKSLMVESLIAKLAKNNNFVYRLVTAVENSA